MTVLAASTSAFDQPGTVAFLVIFGMAVLLYFVFRSMSRHLRKVNMAARDEAEAAAHHDQESRQGIEPFHETEPVQEGDSASGRPGGKPG